MRRTAMIAAASAVSLIGLGCNSGSPERERPPAVQTTPVTQTPTARPDAGTPVMSTPDADRIGLELVDRDHALPRTYAPQDLVAVTPGYEPKRTYELRLEAAEAWTQMHAAARLGGVELRVVSAFRSFEYQQTVYDDAVRRMGADQQAVAKPGHSEHQLGTAVDVAGADDETVLKTEFGDTPAGKWLTAHAPAFGFAISYTAANRAITGYIPEPWHYRYVGSAARARHEAALAGR